MLLQEPEICSGCTSSQLAHLPEKTLEHEPDHGLVPLVSLPGAVFS